MYDEALEKYEEALEIKKRIGDVSGEAISLHQIGMIYQERGLYDEALEKYEESLEITKRIGDVSGEASSLHQIGSIYQERGSYDVALVKYEEALEIEKRIGNVNGEAFSYGQLGQFSKKMKKYKEALDYSTKAYLICKKIQIPNISLAKKDILSLEEYFNPKEFESILKEQGISLTELEQGDTAPNQEEMMRQLIELYVSLGEEKFVDMLIQNGMSQEQVDQLLPEIKKMSENE